MTDAQNFKLEEYKALRREVELFLVEVRSHERYTLIAVGVIWGWLIFNHNHHGLLWSVPALITLGSALRIWAMNRHFSTVAGHVEAIEKEFGVDGWETRRGNRPPSIGTSSAILAVVLISLACAGWVLRFELAASSALPKI